MSNIIFGKYPSYKFYVYEYSYAYRTVRVAPACCRTPAVYIAVVVAVLHIYESESSYIKIKNSETRLTHLYLKSLKNFEETDIFAKKILFKCFKVYICLILLKSFVCDLLGIWSMPCP